MSLRTVSAIVGLGLVAGGGGCILPDIQDDPGSTQETTEGMAGAAGSSPSGGNGGGMNGAGGSGGAGGAGGDTSMPACDVSGPIALRFANVAPEPAAVDFCLGANGNLSGPVAKVANSPGGIAYKSFMYYDYVVSGTLDVRVIPAGGTCSGESWGDITDLCPSAAGAGAAISIYYVAGQAAGKPPLVALEDSAVDAGALKLRFFNSIQGAPGADFGLTDGAALPTTLSTAVASNIPFGAVPPPGNTILNVPVNEAGYLEITSLPSDLTWQGWGVALSGEASASAVVPFTSVSSNMGIVLTVVEGGLAGGTTHPPQISGFPAAPAGGAPKGPTQSPDVDTTLN
jgi:hypothetical protein